MIFLFSDLNWGRLYRSLYSCCNITRYIYTFWNYNLSEVIIASVNCLDFLIKINILVNEVQFKSIKRGKIHLHRNIICLYPKNFTRGKTNVRRFNGKCMTIVYILSPFGYTWDTSHNFFNVIIRGFYNRLQSNIYLYFLLSVVY